MALQRAPNVNEEDAVGPQRVADRGVDAVAAGLAGQVGVVDQRAQRVGDLGRPHRAGIHLGRVVEIATQVRGAQLVGQLPEGRGVVVLVAVVHDHRGGARGVRLRREGLSEEQAREAVDFYIAGRSLAWIAHHFGGISPTTVSRVLRNQGIPLRPRPGST
jgi:hypothetical protein